MPTRNVNLTDYYDNFVAQLLESGRFRNASEVVRAALRLLENQNLEEQAKIEALRNAFKEGHESYARGDYVVMKSEADIDRFFDEMDAEIDRAS
ncbi:MAG: type II toxin-antitoxin system ParD family antitoxin [Rhodospirillales bacterium]